MTRMSADRPPRSTAVFSPLCRRCTVRPPRCAAGDLSPSGEPPAGQRHSGAVSSLVRTLRDRPASGHRARAARRPGRHSSDALRRTRSTICGAPDSDHAGRRRSARWRRPARTAYGRPPRPPRRRAEPTAGAGSRAAAPARRRCPAPSAAGEQQRRPPQVVDERDHDVDGHDRPRASRGPASTAAEKTATLANRPITPGRQPGQAEQEEAERQGGERAGARTGRGSRSMPAAGARPGDQGGDGEGAEVHHRVHQGVRHGGADLVARRRRPADAAASGTSR